MREPPLTPLWTIRSTAPTTATVTLALNLLRDEELDALVQVFQELGQGDAEPSERLAAAVLGPLVDALHTERSERLAGQLTAPRRVDLRLLEWMRRSVIAFFVSFLAALPSTGPYPMAAVFMPLVTALQRDDPRPLN